MKKCLLLLILAVYLCSAFSLETHRASLSEFCWKDSQGRGIGTIPSNCENGRVKIGLLCYKNCPSGYSRFGFDCHQNCPTSSGWVNQGLFCRLAEYGRGVGYPWNFGDGFNDNGMRGRCQRHNGKGKCQKNGLIYYPKCRAGYNNFGCCICRPKTPNCRALGYNGGLDLSCAKKIILAGPVPMICGASLQYDAGLCYKGCGSGFSGVGPVCWESNPAGWVNCGIGAAKNTKVCAQTIFDQVTSVGNLALNIAIVGTEKAVTISKDAAKIADLKKKFSQLAKALKDKNEKIQAIILKAQGKFPASVAGKSLKQILSARPENLSPEDIVRASAQIASLADPTVFVAKKYSKCSSIRP